MSKIKLTKVIKKPIEVEAFQFQTQTDKQLRGVMGDAFAELGWTTKPGKRYITIATPEGKMNAISGDWIIKGIEGEFYPIKETIFKKTYEVKDE